jgi:hypothetical protein
MSSNGAGIAAAVIGSVGLVTGTLMTAHATMTSSEISALHAALFFAMVWIGSSRAQIGSRPSGGSASS